MSQKNLLHYLADALSSYRLSQTKNPDSHKSRWQSAVQWFLPNGGTILIVLFLILTQNVWASPSQSTSNIAGSSATTVNYQGRLADTSGNPKTGTFGMSFAIWDSASDGSIVWGPENHSAVPTTDGLFNVGLGSQTSGGIPATVWNGDRYLEITVGGETLAPRELIRSVPIAGMALTVPGGSIQSENLNLASGSTCLANNKNISLTDDWTPVSIPELDLEFSLSSPSKVMIWMTGLAKFNRSTSGEGQVRMLLNGNSQIGGVTLEDNHWFSLNGQRMLELESGTHNITAETTASAIGNMAIHSVGPWQTCVYYLVLGEQ